MINLLEQVSDGDEKFLRRFRFVDGYDYNLFIQFNLEVSRKQVKDDFCEIVYFVAVLDKL